MSLRSLTQLTFVGIVLSFVIESAAQQKLSGLDEVQQLNLPSRTGAVPVYYSACCKSRAMEVQSMLEDCLHFYKEKFGIQEELVAAVLDKNDWERTHRPAPYGMTHFATRPDVAFIPADDGGVITQDILTEKTYETPETVKLLQSLHMSFDEASRKFIAHPTLHELGHVLIFQYGIQPPEAPGARWFDELLASYFAYAYEKTKRPEIATIVEAMTAVSRRPPKYTALEDLPKAAASGASDYIWYEFQFEARVHEVYAKQGLDFLAKVKAAFPAGARDDLRPAEVLSKLELISPGFEAWALKLAKMKARAEIGAHLP